MKFVYCDYLSYLTRNAFVLNDWDKLIRNVSSIRFDLGPNGEFLSTKKSIEVEARNGTRYRVTIEEIEGGQE